MTPTLSQFFNHQHVALKVMEKEEDKENMRLRRWIKLQVHQPTHRLNSASQNGDQSRRQIESDAAAVSKPSHAASDAHIAADTKDATVDPAASHNSSTPSSASSSAASSPPSPSSLSPSSSHSSSPFSIEFGSICIYVSHLPECLRDDLWSGRAPFASLLLRAQPPIIQKVRPQAFFAIKWDKEIRKLIGEEEECDGGKEEKEDEIMVYGRCTSIFSADDVVLCEVVEILPPFAHSYLTR